MYGNILEIINNSYGFINDEEGKEYFFHKNDLKNCTIWQIEEGDAVEFEATRNYKGLAAGSIRKRYQSASELSVVNAGIHCAVKLGHFVDEEKRIVSFLGNIFYITSGGGEFTLGGSTYKYFLIKPTEYFRTTFQLSRELVVIFVDYVNFEPRALDAASAVYNMISAQLRLDRGCHVLICHDELIEDKLSVLLKDSNVNQIVIPFTYKELLSKNISENLIRERFKKYLFDTDLFSVSTPIKEDIFFFGRRDYVHDIVSKCKNNTHSGIFGLRRSGKTSLLYAVKGLLEQQEYPTVFIPCESDLSSLDWRTALCKVVRNVYVAFDMDVSRIRSENDYLWNNATIYFEEDMDACLGQISLPVTIMFDEIEAITFGVSQGEGADNLWVSGKNFVHFWNAIKGYYSKHPNRISILVAGTNPMINEIHEIGKDKLSNPMFKQLSESNQGAYLQPFTLEGTNSMVNTLGGYMGLSFDDYSVGCLTRDCGGHPYLTRLLCSHINKYVRAQNYKRPIKITRAIYDKAVTEFEKSSEAVSFFWMVLNILMTSYPQEFNTLKILALQGDDIISQIQNKESLFHLIGYGLVEYNRNNYAIRYNTITRFLRGEYRFERVGLTIEEQKEEIQLRINSTEMQLRKLVKNTLQSLRGVTRAKEAVIRAMENNAAISDRDITNARGLSYSQLFDASLNKIYFSLLTGIILDNFSVFTNVFEGCPESLIRRNLSVINNARRCPDHSYTENAENWSWDKFVEFRDKISWLENILKEYE